MQAQMEEMMKALAANGALGNMGSMAGGGQDGNSAMGSSGNPMAGMLSMGGMGAMGGMGKGGGGAPPMMFPPPEMPGMPSGKGMGMPPMPGLPSMPGMGMSMPAMGGMGGMQGMGMMGQMMGGMAGMQQMGGMMGGGGGGKSSRAKAGPDISPELQTAIEEFLTKWDLDKGKFEHRLQDQLGKRENWEEDLESLDHTLGNARNPPGLLSTKLRELEDGTFQAKGGGRDRGGGGGGGGGWNSGGGSWSNNDWGGGDWKNKDGGGDWKDWGSGNKSGSKPGDWDCPDCGASVFASKSSCFKCGAAKPKHLESKEDAWNNGWEQKEAYGSWNDKWQKKSSALEGRQMDDIKDLCEKYGIDDRLEKRLADAMGSRQDTFKEDLRSLGDTLATARNPPGLLSTKIREMQDGTFVAKGSGKRGKDDFGSRDYDKDRRRESRSPSRRRDRSGSRKKRDRDRSGSRKRRRRSESRKRSRSKKKDKDKEKDKGKDRDRDRDRDRDKERRDRDDDGYKKYDTEDWDRKKDRDNDRRKGEEEKPYDPEEGGASRSRSRAPMRGSPERGSAVAPPRQQQSVREPKAIDPDDEVHYGIACGGCHMDPIRGDRFKCSVCENYNLCEDCYERKTEVHVASHRFFVQKALPPPAPEAEEPPPPPEESSVPDAANDMTNILEFLPQMQQLEAQMKAAAEATGTHLDPNLLAAQMKQYLATLRAAAASGKKPEELVANASTAPPEPEPAPAPPSPASSSTKSSRSPSPEPPKVAPPEEKAPEPKKEEKVVYTPPVAAAWMPLSTACGFCGLPSTSTDKHAHGVLCFRKRKNGSFGGCNKGVCWKCMEQLPRSKLGMVRTTREEFESLEEEAWWMHESCMQLSDLREYFGSDVDLAAARQAADEADKAAAAAAASSSASKGADKSKKDAPADPADGLKAKVKAMSVKELKTFLERQKVPHAHCVEKADLLALALDAAGKAEVIPDGPAWMPAGMVCRLCTKATAKEMGGIICRRKRPDGTIGGCGEGICWRCMKRAPRESFGKVRTTKEEFESLEEDAWWMHEMCFEDGDYKDYFGESEPEDDRKKRKELRKRRLGTDDADDEEWEAAPEGLYR